MFEFIDSAIIKFDNVLRTILPTWPENHTNNSLPDHVAEAKLSRLEKNAVISMMRVNLAGEVAAQGLYKGQMLFAQDNELKNYFARAAQEEECHYSWCRQRLMELEAKPSVFNPLWYYGAFILGLLAAQLGDKKSLGFVIATEELVSNHLAGHLQRLPEQDLRSRAIVAKMYEEELGHALDAEQRGGERLPLLVLNLMHCASQVMIKTSSLV